MSNIVEIVNKSNKNSNSNSNNNGIHINNDNNINNSIDKNSQNIENKELNNNLDIATKLNNMMVEIIKLKNGVDYQNTTMIRLSAMSDKVNILETQNNELAKAVALSNESSEKIAKRQERLEKTVIDALKNIIDNNETGNKVVRSQIKKLSESFSKSLSFKLWKIPEMNIFSVILLVLLMLGGYLSLIISLLHFFF